MPNLLNPQQKLNYETNIALYLPLVTHQDIIYKYVNEKPLFLDILMPTKKLFDKTPVVVYIHGGGWNGGFRCSMMGAARYHVSHALLDAGYAIVSICYTLTDEHNTFPQNIKDSKDAIRWIRKHADTYGFDENNIIAWGSSAGAHLALMIGVTSDESFCDSEELSSYSAHINCVVDENGPICMTMITKQINAARVDEIVKHILGNEYSFDTLTEQDYNKMAESFPNIYLDTKGIPTIITQGTNDLLVPHIHSTILHDKLQKLGCDSELILLENIKHGLGNTTEEQKQYICERTLSFVKKYTK